MKFKQGIVSGSKIVRRRRAAKGAGVVNEVSDVSILGAVSKTAWSKYRIDDVELLINDRLVMTTQIDGSSGELEYSFGVYDFWRFAKRDDHINVRYVGQALVMPNGALYEHPRRNGKEDLEALDRRLQKGQGFNHEGKLYMPSKDEDFYWQHGVLELYAKVDAIIRTVTGGRSFIYSGTLLGYVREKGFIPHDMDMDCAYVSEQYGADAVSIEFELLGSALIDAGFHVTPKASCISVRERGGSRVMVDIAHLFVKDDGNIGFPFGTVGTHDVLPETLLPVQSGMLGGFPVGLPHLPEAMVAHIYGEGWKTPNPDFKWSKERRRRDPQALLSYSQRSRLAMDDYYSHEAVTHPSDFVSWVVAQPSVEDCSFVLDIGCGNGRDSLALGGTGRSVLAVDRSVKAVNSATTQLEGVERVRVIHADVLDEGNLAELADSCRREQGGSILFYFRFVLNGLTESEEAILFQELGRATRLGDSVALEHRSDLDEGRKKALFRSFRRFIPVDDTVRRLRDTGFALEIVESGLDRAKFKREDPEVARFFATRLAD